jgi:hypothetical protein
VRELRLLIDMVGAKTACEFAIIKGKPFEERLAYPLWNRNINLTFRCYTRNRVEMLRQLLGIRQLMEARDRTGNQNETAGWLEGGESRDLD